jgi:hypothetical protein
MAATVAHGSLAAPQSPRDLAELADLIVIGTANGITQGEASVNFSLTIDRVLKGAPSLSAGTISVGWPTPPANAAQSAVGSAPAGVGSTGMWFLQESPDGWALLPVVQGNAPFSMTYYPSAPGPILSPYTYSASASLLDIIAAELSSAIEASNGAYIAQFYGLQFGLIDQLNSSYVSLLFTRMSNSTPTAQQIVGLSGLIRGGSSAALTSADQSVSTFAAYAKESGILLFSVRDRFRAADAVSVGVLGKAATDSTNSTASFCEASAHALAAMHTAATLPYLAALLGDQDANIRVEAIGGIGSFANGLAMQTAANVASLAYLQYPASAPYMTAETRANFVLGAQAVELNEAAYLSYWSQWWSQNRVSLGF